MDLKIGLAAIEYTLESLTHNNLSLLKKIVLNLIRADKTDTVKTSLRLKRKRAAWDDDIRMKMLGIHPL